MIIIIILYVRSISIGLSGGFYSPSLSLCLCRWCSKDCSHCFYCLLWLFSFNEIYEKRLTREQNMRRWESSLMRFLYYTLCPRVVNSRLRGRERERGREKTIISGALNANLHVMWWENLLLLLLLMRCCWWWTISDQNKATNSKAKGTKKRLKTIQRNTRHVSICAFCERRREQVRNAHIRCDFEIRVVNWMCTIYILFSADSAI